MNELRVRDLMTPKVVTVRPDDTIAMAHELMLDHRFRHLVVVDAEGDLVGLLTQRDLLRHSLTEWLLEEGGHLCVADLEAEDGSFHSDDFHGHHGFERDDLASQLAAAGFSDVAFRDCYRIDRDGVDYQVFLATCTRTA